MRTLVEFIRRYYGLGEWEHSLPISMRASWQEARHAVCARRQKKDIKLVAFLWLAKVMRRLGLV